MSHRDEWNGEHQAAGEEREILDIAQECLRRTIVFVWSAVKFPPGNKAIQEAAEKWRAAMAAVFARRNSFFLAHFKDSLYFEDVRLDVHDEMSQHFLETLANRRIRKVVILPEATPSDLEKFSRLLAGKAVDLIRQGGPSHVLEGLGVRSIQIVEEESRPSDKGDAQGEHWEVKLGQLGLDKAEILDFLSGKGRLPRLLSDELRLLVEAMKDPLFLAQVIVHLAMADGQAGQPAAGEVFRLAKRFQYILVSHALFSPAETPRALRRGMQALAPDLRLRLLAEKVRMEAQGACHFEDGLFGFTPGEYARWLVGEFERGGSWRAAAAPLRATGGRAGELARAFRATLLASPACPSEDAAEEEVAALERGLGAPLELPPAPAPGGETFPVPPPRAVGEAVQGAMLRCPEDLETGYAAALLAMLGKAQRSASQVLDRLLEVLERRVAEARHDAALELLASILPSGLGGDQLVRRRNRIQANLPPPSRDALMRHVAQKLLEGDALATGHAELLASLFGGAFLEEVGARCFADHRNEPSPALLAFASKFEAHCLPHLKEKLHSREPFDRIRAVELLAVFDSSAAQSTVLSAVDDHDPGVRLVALLSMGRGTSAAGIARLMRVARRRHHSETAENERCAAVLALGRLGHAPAVPLLEEILARKAWFHSPTNRRLEVCAALALKEIARPEALAALRRQLGTIGFSKLDMMRRRKKCSETPARGKGEA